MTTPAARLRLLPLRVKLVLSVLVLVAVGLLVSGLTATSVLRSYLIDQADQDLGQASAQPLRSFGSTDGGRGGPGGGNRFNRYYVLVLNADGTPYPDASGNPLQITTGDPSPRLPKTLSTTPVTVQATSGDGRWRVVAEPGPENTTLVFGTSITAIDREVTHLLEIEAVVGLVVLALLAGAAYGVVRTSLRPLREVEQTAAAIAGGDLSLRVPRQDDRTEVGRLALAFNSMLGRIETAFSAQQASEAQARESEGRMRRFVGDASHELRTPLTSIRGFAELYRQGAVPPGPDLDRVMGRVEGEAARMGQLVEEMLLLARLDQQREMERKPVDLLQLAADAVHDAQAVDPGRPIKLEVQEEGDAPVVLGDEARLRQVLVNLLGNAVTHTPAGSPVAVHVSTAGRQALVEVADCGPGLTPEQASQVFERFYRADSARNRASGGSGLGLSIVRAVVEAHGGRVGVRSTRGEGATFLVELPLAG